ASAFGAVFRIINVRVSYEDSHVVLGLWIWRDSVVLLDGSWACVIGSAGKFYLFYVVACGVGNRACEGYQQAASSLDAVVGVKTVSAVAIFGACGRHKLTDTTSSSVGYCVFVIAGFLGEQCVQNGHGQASFFGGIFNSILILGWNA